MCFSSFEHIIGVSVSETTAETRIVIDKRHRELAEQSAHDVAHEQQRNQHRDQRNGERDDREPDLLRALQRGLQRMLALLDDSA